jgi:DNA-binding NarL/FixJ family response regulator
LQEATVDIHNGATRNRSGDGAHVDVATPRLQEAGALASQSRYARRGVPVGDELTRVLLVDDHAILRKGLRALLKSAADIQVVGEAGDGKEAVTLARRISPDVVVLDLEMPGGDGATAVRELLRLTPSPKILILTMHTEEERLVPLLKDGAHGFLSKDCADCDLVEAIRVVAAGEFFVRPAVARLLAANATPKHASPVDTDRKNLGRLSVRERFVLQHVAEGYSGVEIARMLNITPKSVETYKNRNGQKLGFTHRTEYVRFALRLGLLGAYLDPPRGDT